MTLQSQIKRMNKSNKATAELAALRARVEKLEGALVVIADKRNWRNVKGEIVWNDFDGNEYFTEHAIDIARSALDATN